jgi:hypothetical protein
MTQKYSFELFADYFQFYLQDDAVIGDLSESWTPEAVDRLLAVAPGVIGVGTVRNMNVSVDVEVFQKAPDESLDAWDRVNECSVILASGRAVVAGCTDNFPDAARIAIPPGVYRARICYGNLASLNADGLEGGDHYRIALWPSVEGPVVQIKVPLAMISDCTRVTRRRRIVAQSEERLIVESESFMNDLIPSSPLRDGRQIEVEVSGPSDSMSAVAIRVTRDGKVISEVDLPYPRPGLAGGRIILSPSEHLAVVSMFSGQSEESYELFWVGNEIKRVTGIPYQYGEVASFCFSEHEDVLVMALPFTCCEWWQLPEIVEAEPDDDRLAFGFGQIRVHEIATNTVSVHEIRVSVEKGWKPSEADYDPDLKPRLKGDRLLLSMPWGETEIPFPIPNTILIRVGG